MRIGELSRLTRVSERSLRQKGLLLHSKRLDNGYRDFDPSAVERVKTIQLYLGLGLNTEQIEGILIGNLSGVEALYHEYVYDAGMAR